MYALATSGTLINFGLLIEQNGSGPGRARALPLWLALLREKVSAQWTNRKAFAGKGGARWKMIW
jgi:hypothetical protein